MDHNLGKAEITRRQGRKIHFQILSAIQPSYQEKMACLLIDHKLQTGVIARQICNIKWFNNKIKFLRDLRQLVIQDINNKSQALK